ncbi:MAG: hypothetical protein GY835_04605 [bacterium]|nr:hypothetical protein [bacterium]
MAEVDIAHNSSSEAQQVPALKLTEDLSIGVEDPEEGPAFGYIFDIAVSDNGEIYVLDYGFFRVQVFSASGALLRTISRQGEGPGEVSNPSAIALGPDNLFYIADNSRIKVFSASGESLDEFVAKEATGRIRGLAIGADGCLYVSSSNLMEQKIIHKYNSDHKWVSSYCNSFAVGQNVDVRLERVGAGGFIDLTSDGNLLYAPMCHYEIRLFTPSGELLRRMFRETDFIQLPRVEFTAESTTYESIGGCTGIVSLPSGAFLCTAIDLRNSDEFKTLVDCFTPQGKLQASHDWDANFKILCVDNLGKVYAAHFDGECPRVVRYSVNW